MEPADAAVKVVVLRVPGVGPLGAVPSPDTVTWSMGCGKSQAGPGSLIPAQSRFSAHQDQWDAPRPGMWGRSLAGLGSPQQLFQLPCSPLLMPRCPSGAEVWGRPWFVREVAAAGAARARALLRSTLRDTELLPHRSPSRANPNVPWQRWRRGQHRLEGSSEKGGLFRCLVRAVNSEP